MVRVLLSMCFAVVGCSSEATTTALFDAGSEQDSGGEQMQDAGIDVDIVPIEDASPDVVDDAGEPVHPIVDAGTDKPCEALNPGSGVCGLDDGGTVIGCPPETVTCYWACEQVLNEPPSCAAYYK
jgi:hypothetical protein